METPDTEAGQMTDEIMRIIDVYVPNLSIDQYNKLFARLLKYLDAFPKLRDTRK